MARLYTPDGPRRGVPAEVVVSASHLLADGGTGTVSLSWSEVAVRFEGLDDAFVVFASTTTGGLEVWVERQVLKDLRGIQDHLPEPFASTLKDLLFTQTTMQAGMAIWTISGVVAVLGILFWLARGGLVDIVMASLPPEVDQSVGESLFAESKADACSHRELTLAVERITARLEYAADDPPFKIRVVVTKSPQVNAFALPGGFLTVTAGLLEESESPDEIAAIMGHEIGHALERHGMRRIVREVGMSALLSIVAGDPGTAQTIATKGSEMLGLAFDRGQETASDRIGLQLMARAGYDPDRAPDFFRRLAAKESLADQALALLSTHPASAARVQDLEQLAASVERGPAAPSVDNWMEIRDGCSR